MISVARPFDARAHADARAATHDEIEHARFLEHANALGVAHASHERARDLGAGLIAVRVDDAILRVRRLAPELEPAARIEIELRAGGLQLANARRAFFDQHLHRRRVAQRRTRGERVLPVERGRVAGAERGGDAALRVRGGAVEQRALGEQQHVAVLRRAPRRVQPGDAAADDEKPRANPIGHAERYQRGSASSAQVLAPVAAAHDCFAMRKLLILVAVLVVVHVALLFVHVSGAAQPATRGRRQRRHRARRRRPRRQVVQRRRLPRRRARGEGARRAHPASSSPATAPIARPACACSPPSTWIW